MGLLYPALAGLAMAASSVSVTASSLALQRWNAKK
jgi:P-type Cu+ transporter